ncbi:hypothetical protein JMM81_12855 [Bacillus sp. V3B]|uniref:hypothetical protein n=1 Tax=Bacillus sp. V3B TaxID=2804915 RepID=UPI00210D3E71|nr:hypothetical protein [Bacillus sp. V3B]MCQ6275840.1 hypothetical protein [Bacillus sp. V3B]
MPQQQTNKSEKQKGELITNRQGSEYHSEYADNVPDYRTNTTDESNTICSSEQEEFDDPVIRATIQKFNYELANEENNQC